MKRKKIFLLLIIAGFMTLTVVMLPIFLKKPYFIHINNNADLESWSSSGSGTVDDPYIIEYHHISVPRNDYDDFDTPCIPEKSVISICGVTKSFIIQNNVIEVKGGCEGQYIIKISDVSVPFTIRNNILRGGLYAYCIKLEDIDGQGSLVSNNYLYEGSTSLKNVNDISFNENKFSTRGNAFGFYTDNSTNVNLIHNSYFLYPVYFKQCSYVLIERNTFENDEDYSGWTLLGIKDTEYYTITNNNFIRGNMSID